MLRLTCTLLSLILSIGAVSLPNKWDRSGKSDDSMTNLIANIILTSINRSVDPCDNFYDYACGSWNKNYPLPSDRSSWSLDRMTVYDIKIRLRDILEQEVKPDDIFPLKYEKLWFQSCMNLEKLENDAIKPLEDIINEAGGWPMIRNKESKDVKNWQEVHKYYMAFYEVNALFNIFVGTDVRNSSAYIIKVSEPDSTLYEAMLKDQNVEYSLKKYENFMKKVAIVFARSTDNNNLEDNIVKDVKDVMEFENKLHLIKSTADGEVDFYKSQNYFKIKELQEFYNQMHRDTNNSKINWLEVIEDTFKETSIKIEDSEEIHVIDKTYLKKLPNLLDNVPNRVIVNYIHWKFLMYSLEFTNREMINLAVEAALEHRGWKKEPERWLGCLDDMKLKYGLMHEYINKYFPEDKRKLGLDIAVTIRDEMIHRIQQSSWLDNSTKKKTISKLEKLRVHMGYTNILNNETYMEHIYDQFSIGSSYCQTYQNYRKYEMKRNLQLLRTHDDKNSDKRLLMSPLIANAIYQPHINSLMVTAAQLSIPFFNTSIPTSVNYGYVGSIIGHEISHTIDNDGRLFDEDGNVKTWWPQDMIEEFKKKSQCFIRQYNNYSLNGKLSLNENMADAIGVQVSYNAYKNVSSKKDAKRTKLQGLEELSDDQLFFISFAVSFCQSASAQFWTQLSDDEHSPDKFRVIGTVSNSESFARAFSCPLNSSMNPITKCDFWS